MASSIHIANGTSSMGIHNTRVFAPDYLIVADKSVNEYKSFTDKHINDLVEMAKSDYKAHQKNNRSLPKNATLIKEAIVNLESHHTMEDMEDLKSKLEERFGYKISNISIHKDEGYIYTDKINYTMGREQYKNQEETPHIAELDIKDNKFYEWHKINNEWTKGKEISEYEIKFNYHAHIEMLNYDFKTHRTIRNNITGLSEMQTLVAETLGMQRGKCSSTVEAERIGVEVQESRKRMNIKDYKNYKRKENELKSELTKVKEENQELKKYDFKEMQKKITQLEELNSSQKRELHQLNSQVKNHKAEFETLQKKIAAYTKTFKTIAPAATKQSEVIEKVDQLQQEIKDLKTNLIGKDKVITKQNEAVNSSQMILKVKEKEINTLKTQINSLEAQKDSNPSKDITKEEKTLSRPNMDLYQELKGLQKDFNSSFEKKEYKKSMFSSEYLDTLKPVENKEDSLLSKIKSRFNGLYEYMSEKIKEVENAYKSIIAQKDKRINSLVSDKVQLTKKVEHLEERVNKLEKEKTLSHTGKDKVPGTEKKQSNAMDLIKEMQSKSISKDDINKMAQELRESNSKNKGLELDR